MDQFYPLYSYRVVLFFAILSRSGYTPCANDELKIMLSGTAIRPPTCFITLQGISSAPAAEVFESELITIITSSGEVGARKKLLEFRGIWLRSGEFTEADL